MMFVYECVGYCVWVVVEVFVVVLYGEIGCYVM